MTMRSNARDFPLPPLHPLALALAAALGVLLAGMNARAADSAPGAELPAPGADAAPGDEIDTATFDPNLLKQRGFDPQLAEYLKRAPRFTPGTHQVDLVVNGLRRGKTLATFDNAGKLCFNLAFAEVAGLKPPAMPPGATCTSVENAYPMAVAELQPEIGGISLVVPMDAVKPESRATPGYARGGTGGLLNYEVFGSSTQFNDLNSDHLIANTEVGLNAGNWVFRSAQSYSDSNGVSQFERRHTYAERALMRARSLLQVGDVTMDNAVLAGALVTGVQLKPETGLAPGVRGVIEGIAQTQARVDVRQSGALIYSAVVPPGPFQLGNLQLIDRVSAVDVTVTEADGSERRFSVPAASLDSVATAAPTGYTATIGRVRDQSNTMQAEPWVASASGTWAAGKTGTYSAGAMGAQGYASVGVGAQKRWDDWGTYLSGQVAYANASRREEKGTQVNLAVQQRLSQAVSLNASALKRTEGFRDLLESTQEGEFSAGRTDTTWSVGTSFASRELGTLGASYSRTSTYDDIEYARGTLSWGKQIRGVSLSASAEWDLDDVGEQNDDALYFTVTVPLGSSSRRASAGYNRRAERDRYSVRYEDSPTDTFRYRLNAERDTQYGDTDMRADVSMLPRYTQLDLGYSHGSDGDNTKSYGLRGGAVLHRDGVTFSPYPIDDSFGILKLGSVPGVKVQTPAGPVWTDWSGQAVVPQLQPYRMNAIELITKTLPRNINVANARHELEVGRGSVQHIAFDVMRARRVLLLAKMLDGSPVPSGATVIDGRNKLVTMVSDGGEIFMTNDPAGEAFGIHLPEGGECILEFKLPATPDPDAYYETINATCRPGSLKKELAIGQVSQVTVAP
ncbi:fimbria/pilus outer membrane usher protein [Lysobacter sp. A6]|uniref:Fimbria/pilus outer membrane usher protein n=1 Tax=Noviluteimonas lactosilytica TaxID=2888523 RepID=A0ABS8JH07_9GAMM|nr:fimbria/pilus outer membrane usher protein [Lysobacter lactosilyticus]MCC8362790.1 fimbria/pilus outer membrane usher protein [Lysobacter lactosilyticus]